MAGCRYRKLNRVGVEHKNRGTLARKVVSSGYCRPR